MPISEHLPVFRAPHEGDGRSTPVHGHWTSDPPNQSTDAKKIAWEGDRHRTDIATTRSNRPSGPIR